MVRWARLADDEAARTWDRDLAALPGRSFVQSFGWGNYKATQGWTPLRWTAQADGERPVAMLQALVRTYPCRTVVVWCPGGLAGPIDFWTSEVLDEIGVATRARRLYCRVVFTRERAEADSDYLRAHGWVTPRQTISAPRTMTWDLPATDEDMLAGLRGSWRHNLTRGLKRGLHVVRWSEPSVASLVRLFQMMASYKDIDTDVDASSLEALFRHLPDQILTYVCQNDSGEPIAVRACALQSGLAWDLLAATSPEGRRCYASYAVLWALVRECRALGVRRYDLSGIDPLHAPGVYEFKRGTGARELDCLGEWEWTTSALLARAVNFRVKARSGATLA